MGVFLFVVLSNRSSYGSLSLYEIHWQDTCFGAKKRHGDKKLINCNVLKYFICETNMPSCENDMSIKFNWSLIVSWSSIASTLTVNIMTR